MKKSLYLLLLLALPLLGRGQAGGKARFPAERAYTRGTFLAGAGLHYVGGYVQGGYFAAPGLLLGLEAGVHPVINSWGGGTAFARYYYLRGRVRPFVQALGGYGKLVEQYGNIDEPPRPDLIDGYHWVYGGGGGLDVRLSRTLALELSGTALVRPGHGIVKLSPRLGLNVLLGRKK